MGRIGYLSASSVLSHISFILVFVLVLALLLGVDLGHLRLKLHPLLLRAWVRFGDASEVLYEIEVVVGPLLEPLVHHQLALDDVLEADPCGIHRNIQGDRVHDIRNDSHFIPFILPVRLEEVDLVSEALLGPRPDALDPVEVGSVADVLEDADVHLVAVPDEALAIPVVDAGVVHEDGHLLLPALVVEAPEKGQERGLVEGLPVEHGVVDEPPLLTGGGDDGDVLVGVVSLVPLDWPPRRGPLGSLPRLAGEAGLVDGDELAALILGYCEILLQTLNLHHLFLLSLQDRHPDSCAGNLLGHSAPVVEAPQEGDADGPLVALREVERPRLQGHAHLPVQGRPRDHVVELLLLQE